VVYLIPLVLAVTDKDWGYISPETTVLSGTSIPFPATLESKGLSLVY